MYQICFAPFMSRIETNFQILLYKIGQIYSIAWLSSESYMRGIYIYIYVYINLYI